MKRSQILKHRVEKRYYYYCSKHPTVVTRSLSQASLVSKKTTPILRTFSFPSIKAHSHLATHSRETHYRPEERKKKNRSKMHHRYPPTVKTQPSNLPLPVPDRATALRHNPTPLASAHRTHRLALLRVHARQRKRIRIEYFFHRIKNY